MPKQQPHRSYIRLIRPCNQGSTPLHHPSSHRQHYDHVKRCVGAYSSLNQRFIAGGRVFDVRVSAFIEHEARESDIACFASSDEW